MLRLSVASLHPPGLEVSGVRQQNLRGRCCRASPMDPRKPVRNQLLAEIVVLRLHESIKTLDIAAAHRICFTSKNSERLRQLVAHERLGRLSHFVHLRHGYSNVSRLLNQAPRIYRVGFGRIDQIESKDVLLTVDVDVKTVSIVRLTRNEPAIFKSNPIFATRSKVDNRQPNRDNDK